MDGKIVNGIKSMYVANLAYVRVKWAENESFMIDCETKLRHVPFR